MILDKGVAYAIELIEQRLKDTEAFLDAEELGVSELAEDGSDQSKDSVFGGDESSEDGSEDSHSEESSEESSEVSF